MYVTYSMVQLKLFCENVRLRIKYYVVNCKKYVSTVETIKVEHGKYLYSIKILLF